MEILRLEQRSAHKRWPHDSVGLSYYGETFIVAALLLMLPMEAVI